MRSLPLLVTLVVVSSIAGCRCTVDGNNDGGPLDSGPGGSGGGGTAGGGGGTAGGGGGGSGGGGTGGATDAGMDAGTDAGTDAGLDAGTDAGFDAGLDAGPRDAGILGDVSGTVLSHGQCQLMPVPAAAVTLRRADGGVSTTTTDPNGRFRFSAVPQGAVQVAVTPERFWVSYGPSLGSHQLPLQVRPNQDNALTFYLAPGCFGSLALTGGTATATFRGRPCPDGMDVTIEAEANDLVLPDGGLFAGTALVEVSAPTLGRFDDGGLDLSSVLSMPGNMVSRVDGGAVLLDTFGALELSMIAEGTGEPLQVAPGQTLRVVHRGLALPPPLPSVPGYFFDVALGQWLRDGAVTVVDGGYAFELAHLSWWNPDVPVSLTSCMRGRVRRNGVPVPGASVIVYSQSGGAQAVSLSAEPDGTFCTDARPDMALWYSARIASPGLAPVLDAVASGFLASTADGGRSCGTAHSACVDVGDLDVVDVPAVCITGTPSPTPLDDGGFGPSPEPFSLAGRPPAAAYGGRPVRCDIPVPLVPVFPASTGQFCASVPGNGEYVVHITDSECGPSPFVVDGGVGGMCGADGGCFNVGEVQASGSCG